MSATLEATARPSTRKGPPQSSRRRVFVVEDHPIVRFGLRELFNAQPALHVCGEASESAQALKLIAQSRPDIVLLDISIEGRNGLELVKEIRALRACEKLLVTSMHDEMLYAERALRAGAMGYVQKADGIERILEGARRVLDGGLFLS